MKTPPEKMVECPKCRHEFLVSLNALTCLRCRHRWVPRTFDVRQCPKCQSVRWDEAPERPAAAATPTASAPPSPAPLSWRQQVQAMALAELDVRIPQYEAKLAEGVPDHPKRALAVTVLEAMRARRGELQNGTSPAVS